MRAKNLKGHHFPQYYRKRTSQVALVVKHLPADARDVRDVGLIPGSGRSPGGGHGNPFQYSCLENGTEKINGLQSIESQRVKHN